LSVRVLLVDPSQRGGIAAYTQLLARALQEEGVSVEVLGSRELGPTPPGLGVLRRLPSGPWGKPEGAGLRFYVGRVWLWLLSAREIAGQVRRLRPDIVHFQAPINRRFDHIFLRRLAGTARLVWTAHDVLPFEGTPRDKRRLRRIYRLVDEVIVHTEPARQAIHEFAGVDAHVVEHLVPPVEPTPQEDARRVLGLPVEERILSALGFVRGYKGYSLLADVWDALGDDAPLLFLLGEPDGTKGTRDVLERLAQSPRAIARPGYATERDLHLAVAASDALLLPYVTSSDSGLLHLARAYRVPVIASDAPQLAAAVRASKAGVVLPREVDSWKEAVQGALPASPPPGPPLSATARSHLAVYAGPVSPEAFHLAVYTDASEFGGAETALATLLGALARPYRVTIVANDRAVADRLADSRANAKVLLVPAVRGKRDVRAIWRLRREIRRLRPDIFQANLRHPWSCQYGLVAALLSRGSLVVAVEHYPVAASAALQRRLKRLVSRRLAAHVAVGERTARSIEALAGLPPGSVRTIHNGVPGGQVAPALRVTDGPLVAAAGRLADHKAFDVLLRALAEVEDASLVLAGDGPERAPLERLAHELGLGERVHFMGWSKDALPLLAAADVVALSSTSEGFPLVALEAMALGKPVVTTDAGSVSEAVSDGETGFVVPIGDAHALASGLRRLLDDPQLAHKLGTRGRERAEALFTPGRMAASFEALYAELKPVAAGGSEDAGEQSRKGGSD
jgi:glycosyltransferase involved in cell wall biosynthesis